MLAYDCKVRLAGSVNNEVRKYGITAAEIAMLKYTHGPDAVVEITTAGLHKATPLRDEDGNFEKGKDGQILTRPIQPDEERAYLDQAYGYTDDRKHLKTREVFGLPGVPLPDHVPGVEPTRAAKAKRDKAPPPAPIVEPVAADILS